MGFLRSVTRAFRSVTRAVGGIAKSALNIATKSLGSLTSMISPALGMAKNLLAGTGLGKMIGGFAKSFLSSPLAMMAMGPLGMFAGLLGMSKGTGELKNNLQTADRQSGGFRNQDPAGRNNLAQITAYTQAQQHFSFSFFSSNMG